jgi:hypothetical protein
MFVVCGERERERVRERKIERGRRGGVVEFVTMIQNMNLII